jgi:hypothetical protein
MSTTAVLPRSQSTGSRCGIAAATANDEGWWMKTTGRSDDDEVPSIQIRAGMKGMGPKPVRNTHLYSFILCE